jgi:hypothetical protein
MRYTTIIVTVFYVAICSRANALTFTTQFPWEATEQKKREFEGLTENAKSFYEAISKKDWIDATKYVASGVKTDPNKVYYNIFIADRGSVITPWKAIPANIDGSKAFILTLLYPSRHVSDNTTAYSPQVYTDIWVSREGQWVVIPEGAIDITSLSVDYRPVDGFIISKSEAEHQEKKREALAAKQEAENLQTIQEALKKREAEGERQKGSERQKGLGL